MQLKFICDSPDARQSRNSSTTDIKRTGNTGKANRRTKEKKKELGSYVAFCSRGDFSLGTAVRAWGNPLCRLGRALVGPFLGETRSVT